MASAVGYDDDYETDSELGVDSDVESNFSTLPSGGYIDSRSGTRNLSAEHSSGWRDTGTKAQEASQRDMTSRSLEGPTQAMWSGVEAPVVNAEPPPPDYEAATASRPYRHLLDHETSMSSYLYSSNQHRNLQYSQTHRESSHVGIDQTWRTNRVTFQAASSSPTHSTAAERYQHQHSVPQSMSDPRLTRRHRPDEETSLLTGVKGHRRKRTWLFCLQKQSICNIMLVIVIIAVVLLALGASGSASENGSNGDPMKDGPPPNGSPSPALPPEASIPSSPECPYEYYSETTSFDFLDIQNFSFVELMESSDWISGGIKGTVNVQPGLQNQSEDVRLSLTYATTKPWMFLASNLVKTDDSLLLQLPNLKKIIPAYSARPCMWVYVNINVRPGVRLDDWELVTGNLDINIQDGLFSVVGGTEDLSVLQIGGSSSLNAMRGDVQAAYWSSRETRIDVISGSIKGRFALRDLLSLKSQSGSIDVVVDPKSADPKHTKPAEYIVQSRSGSINSHISSDSDMPEREYITRVEGQTGSVSGSYILGALGSFHTASGSITVDLLPKFDRKQPSSLHTDTRSGHTKLMILTPHDYPSEPWSEAHTSHKTTSTSGSIDVVYPQEWSGWIEGETISGSIGVKGKDVEIVSDEHRGPVFRHLVARKGIDGQGTIGLKSTSGSLDVRIGEL